MRSNLLLIALYGLLSFACGDSSSPSPTSALPPASTVVPAGTVLSVVSGETGSPVANAQVVLAGKTYGADASGRLTLPEAFPRGSLLDILGPGFLDRQTLLRDSSNVRFTLWPQRSPTGLNSDFTFEIVYDFDGQPQRLMRILPGTTEAYVLPSAAIRADPVAMEVIDEATEMLTDITGGAIRFFVADAAPSGAVSFELIIDSGDPALVNAVAVAKRRLNGWTITGGTVVYVTIATVRTSTTAHELGHMFGLNHSLGPDDVMSTERNRRRGTRQFSAREALVMNLMLQRPPGNEQPDNDRRAPGTNLRAHGESWVSVVVCER